MNCTATQLSTSGVILSEVEGSRGAIEDFATGFLDFARNDGCNKGADGK